MIYMGLLFLKLDEAYIFLDSPSSAMWVSCGKWLACTRHQDM